MSQKLVQTLACSKTELEAERQFAFAADGAHELADGLARHEAEARQELGRGELAGIVVVEQLLACRDPPARRDDDEPRTYVEKIVLLIFLSNIIPD